MKNNREVQQASQGDRAASMIGMILGLFPLITVGYLSFRVRKDPEQMSVILNYMWLVGAVIIAWVLYLQRFIVDKPISDLNRKSGSIKMDLLYALGLAVILFAISFMFGFLYQAPAREAPFSGFDKFIAELAASPQKSLFFVTAGLFLGVAFEEFIRTFTLSRLWEIASSTRMKWLALLFSAIAFGLAHAYQGSGAMLSAAVVGIVLGGFYQWKGRILPMIFAHYAYNLTAFILLIYFM